MWLLDLLKERSLNSQMSWILLAAGLSVGFTKCYLLPGHPVWYGYLSCFVIGYIATAIVGMFAGGLSMYMLDLDGKHDHETVLIIVGLTLIVASVLILVGNLGAGPMEVPE